MQMLLRKKRMQGLFDLIKQYIYKNIQYSKKENVLSLVKDHNRNSLEILYIYTDSKFTSYIVCLKSFFVTENTLELFFFCQGLLLSSSFLLPAMRFSSLQTSDKDQTPLPNDKPEDDKKTTTVNISNVPCHQLPLSKDFTGLFLKIRTISQKKHLS